jgi:hypothetical protein
MNKQLRHASAMPYSKKSGLHSSLQQRHLFVTAYFLAGAGAGSRFAPLIYVKTGKHKYLQPGVLL